MFLELKSQREKLEAKREALINIEADPADIMEIDFLINAICVRIMRVVSEMD